MIVAAVAASAALSQSYNPAVTFEPYQPSGIYAVGQRVGWTLHAPLGLGSQRFHYTIRENNAVDLKSGEVDLSSGQSVIETSVDHPAMIYVRLTPITDLPVDKNASLSAADLDRLTVGAAVAPLSLRPAAPRPADFDTWWAGKLAQLRKVPVNPKLNPVQSPRAEVEMSSVTLDSVGSHVRGYLAKPSKPGKYPALLIYQYAGVYALNPDTSAARAAEGWLTFNVDSHDMAPTEANAPSDYAEQGDQDRETSYFLNMYLRDTRALEYIRSRPDWDGHTVVLMGTSMGGQQSLVTAGLNPGKVTAVLVNVPSGADSQAALYGRPLIPTGTSKSRPSRAPLCISIRSTLPLGSPRRLSPVSASSTRFRHRTASSPRWRRSRDQRKPCRWSKAITTTSPLRKRALTINVRGRFWMSFAEPDAFRHPRRPHLPGRATYYGGI